MKDCKMEKYLSGYYISPEEAVSFSCSFPDTFSGAPELIPRTTDEFSPKNLEHLNPQAHVPLQDLFVGEGEAHIHNITVCGKTFHRCSL